MKERSRKIVVFNGDKVQTSYKQKSNKIETNISRYNNGGEKGKGWYNKVVIHIIGVVCRGIDEIRTRLLDETRRKEEWKCYDFDKVHSQINGHAQIRDG